MARAYAPAIPAGAAGRSVRSIDRLCDRHSDPCRSSPRRSRPRCSSPRASVRRTFPPGHGTRHRLDHVAAARPGAGARLAQQLPRLARTRRCSPCPARRLPATAAGLDYAHRPLPEQFDPRRPPDRARRVGRSAGRQVRAPGPPDRARRAGPGQPGDARAGLQGHPPGRRRHELDVPHARSACTQAREDVVRRASRPRADDGPGRDEGRRRRHRADVRRARGRDPLGVPRERDRHARRRARRLPRRSARRCRRTGWPTLGEIARQGATSRSTTRALRDDYLAGHPSLRGRLLFTPSSPGQDDAAFASSTTRSATRRRSRPRSPRT